MNLSRTYPHLLISGILITGLSFLWHCSRKEDFINSAGIKMIAIPAGEFMMGDSSGQWDEIPVHKVRINTPFYISQTEITGRQFQKFKQDYRFAGDSAAVGISWYEADAFCQWLSEKEGKHYRLPTEAEWEYVCRTEGRNRVLRMLDTVVEWCYDWYGPYPAAPQNNPAGADTGYVKVVRGGLPDIFVKQYTHPKNFYYRPANRSGIAPSFAGFTVTVPLPDSGTPGENINKSFPGLYGLVFDDLAMKKPLMLFPLPLINSGAIKWVSMNNWSARWQGTIEVPAGGDYTFTAVADNKISLEIDGKKVIKTMGNGRPARGTLSLETGKKYPLLLRYIHDGGTSVLKLYWQRKGHPREIVPAGAFTYSGRDQQDMERRYRKGIFSRYVKPSIGFRVVLAPEPGGPRQSYEPPFVQSCVKQTTRRTGAVSGRPYFRRRLLHPVPPDNSTKEEIIAAGLSPALGGHNHHPALVTCPNGDLLAVYFSATFEDDPEVLLMGSRLRYGADEWDMPEPILDFPDINDVSPLAWRDGNKIYIFWGNIHLRGGYPFQWVESTDNGSTFSEVKFPVITRVTDGYSRQPITSVFRDRDGTVYLACDGVGAHSLLWASKDNMKTWYDTGGRTGGRHTAIVPLKDGTFYGVGGKKSDIDGYMPISVSRDKGKSWQIHKSIFPCLGGGQRPALIRLKSGNLLYAGDFQRKDGYQPPAYHERGAFVALSGDEGKTWTLKKLPETLPCVKKEIAREMQGGTLGYVCLAQSDDGMIHLVTSKNEPALHYAFNEAWILASVSEPPEEENTGATPPPLTHRKTFSENYPGGKIRARWQGVRDGNGMFHLDGEEEWFYDNGTKQYEVNYHLGVKTGPEKYYHKEGTPAWERVHRGRQTFTLTYFGNTGQKRSASHWTSFRCAGVAFRYRPDGKMNSRNIFYNGHLRKQTK